MYRAIHSPVFVNGRLLVGGRSTLGLGETSTGTKIAGGVASGFTLGYGTAQATGSAIAGVLAGGIATVAPFTGPAAPFLMAAASLVAPLTRIIRGCGQSCIDASNIANQAEVKLKDLRDSYLAQPVRYASQQAAVLQYMDEVFNWLHQSCQAIGGVAGQKCISERLVRGGTAPWCPTRTGCDWITTLRDPVAKDSAVVSDPANMNLLGFGGGGISSSMLVPVGLGIAAALYAAFGSD